jgi:hypothetical protein
MNKTITKTKQIKRGVRNFSQEFYPIYLERGTPNPGRKSSKLGNTLRILNVGDEFLYPYTTANSVYRLARQLGIFVNVKRTYGGFIVQRVKSDVLVVEKLHQKIVIHKPKRKPQYRFVPLNG